MDETVLLERWVQPGEFRCGRFAPDPFVPGEQSSLGPKMEKVEAAILTFAPGRMVFLRSSPSRALTLSMICIVLGVAC